MKRVDAMQRAFTTRPTLPVRMWRQSTPALPPHSKKIPFPTLVSSEHLLLYRSAPHEQVLPILRVQQGGWDVRQCGRRSRLPKRSV
jgi:hypothetical protein